MKTSRLIIGMLAVLMLASISDSVYAAAFPEKEGYLIDTRGTVVRNTYRECWHTGFWTPAMAIEECEAGLVKKEEQKQAEHVMPAPAPAVASTPAPPAPVQPAMAAAAAPEKPAVAVTLGAETLFDFDKSVVRPEGRKVLDEKIVTPMQMHPEVLMLVITGYADFIGTEEYNQKLSERRANAVKAYLVKKGIPAERMSTSGKGETEPDPEANTRQVCKGVRGEKLIACLQPDRRVTVISQSGASAK